MYTDLSLPLQATLHVLYITDKVRYMRITDKVRYMRIPDKVRYTRIPDFAYNGQK